MFLGGDFECAVGQGCEALLRSREASEYKQTMKNQNILKPKAEVAAKSEAEELQRRADLALHVPAEPELGAAGTTRIAISVDGVTLKRRFESDHTIQRILQWVGA